MFHIDESSTVPPFEQLRLQVIEQIESLVLPPGTKLPAVRRLAGDLGLAPNTVARTYRELEQAGYVITAGRNGTIVAEPVVPRQDQTKAQELADAFVLRMRGMGVTPDATLNFVRRALSALD